ncbi:MAG: biotin--[acetyl-CoA-carboxylase] ligase, partial [Myxococcota bacterium]
HHADAAVELARHLPDPRVRLEAMRVRLEVCDSTNDEAARLAGQGAPGGTVVTALAQRAGRGRLARSWYSPAGENLYLSCLLRPDGPDPAARLPAEPSAVPPIALAAGLAVARAVAALGLAPRLKWPNDVLVDGRKLAGILAEASSRGRRVEYAVVGIGVNLDTVEFPPALAGRATSLRALGTPVERDAFIDALLGHLEQWFERYFAGGVAAVAEPWLEMAGCTGEHPVRVRVEAPTRPATQGTDPDRGDETVCGTIVGLDEGGFLLVRSDRGEVRRVIAGDVIPVSESTNTRDT